jgi:hypothetical protein
LLRRGVIMAHLWPTCALHKVGRVAGIPWYRRSPLRPDLVRFLRLITSSECRGDKRVSARAPRCGVRAIHADPAMGVQWRRGRCPLSVTKKQTADILSALFRPVCRPA